MKLNRLSSLAFLSLLPYLGSSNNAIAKPSINLNIGYTNLNNFEGNITKNTIPQLNGYNLGLDFIFPLSPGFISPLIAVGVNYSDVQGNKNNVDIRFYSTALEVKGGLAINMFPLSVYGLFNFGYGITNNLEANYTGINLVSNVNNHILYGFTVGANFTLLPVLSVGPQIVYNRHYMNIEYIGSNNERTSFDEVSVSLVANLGL